MFYDFSGELIIFRLYCLLAIFACGCKFSRQRRETVKNYRLDKPDKFFMPESLLEVSGITFHKGKKDTVYAIQDEQGRLFRISVGSKKTGQCKIWQTRRLRRCGYCK